MAHGGSGKMTAVPIAPSAEHNPTFANLRFGDWSRIINRKILLLRAR
jgi:hypothetical protein